MTLEVGDVLYYHIGYSQKLARVKIERVTPKQAITSRGLRFDRGQRNTGFCRKGGGDGWERTLYYFETQELKNAWYRQTLITKAEAIKFSELTNDQLRKIIQASEEVEE
jgi:hypothetical protein